MKKLLFLSIMSSLIIQLSSCGSEDGGEYEALDNETYAPVVISEDGTVSNGSRFISIDDKNFYLDYVRYTVIDGHLVVSGFENTAFEGVAKIYPYITVKGNAYEVLSIADFAFYRCRKLTSVVILNGVRTIGDGAFVECSKLISVTIPHSITSIGYNCFQDCINLSKVFISDLKSWCNIRFKHAESNPLWYSHHLFLNGKEIVDLVLPSDIKSISDDAFSGNDFSTIVVDSRNDSLDSHDNCNAIIDKYHLRYLGVDTIFSGANRLLVGCKNTIIPEDVLTIEPGAFSGCVGLTSISIPKSVFRIASDAFWGCNNLESIHCNNPIPPYLYNINGIFPQTTVYVPKGSIDAYKSAWKGSFINFIEE